jgi:hypothetical protein
LIIAWKRIMKPLRFMNSTRGVSDGIWPKLKSLDQLNLLFLMRVSLTKSSKTSLNSKKLHNGTSKRESHTEEVTFFIDHLELVKLLSLKLLLVL